MVRKKHVEAQAVPPPPPAPKPAPAPTSNETYRVIKRGDRYLVEVTLYGRVLFDSKDYARPEDAEVRLKELTKG